MSKLGQDVYIAAIQRTPIGKGQKGAFANVRPDDLLVHAIKGTCESLPNLDPELIGDVIVGCAMPEAEQGMNVARIALLLAGLPESVPGMTINRFCSSGLQSLSMAADRIALGYDDAMLAGGVESMSMIPMGGHNIRCNPKVFAGEENIGLAYNMGITAEIVAERYKISREDQDAFALTSHQKAVAAIDNSAFKGQILPYTIEHHCIDPDNGSYRVTSEIVDTDEGPRRDTSLDVLGKLRPAFAQAGSVTAGNSSQISDGAGIAVLVNEQTMKDAGLTPLARFCGYAVAGVAPDVMGIGPIAAIPKVLKQTGIAQSDIEWLELNEAFAAQSLAVVRELDLDSQIVNPQGGAIALGHPLGATGTLLTAKLLHGLHNSNKRYGMVSMCIGAGMGAAAVFERC